MIARIWLSSLFSLAVLCPREILAQDPEPASADLVIRVEPSRLVLPVGGEARLSAEVVDIGGRPVQAEVMFFSRERRSLRVDRDGRVSARAPGSFEIVARIAGAGRNGVSVTVPVTVQFPEPSRIALEGAPAVLHTGTRARVQPKAVDAAGNARADLIVALASSDPAIAVVDAFGFVSGVRAGVCELRASVGELATSHRLEVRDNPVRGIELAASASDVRTGDVVQLSATARDANGAPVDGVPVHFAVEAAPDDDRGPGASGQIEQDGRFVAETPGLYTVVASCGNAVARHTVRARQRIAESERMRLELVGRGEVLDVHTSDLWVWEGVDGRDYAVTGTWGANGDAHFWDVTDPARIERIATVTVDARTVNDVKVSEDGRICVLSREGASDRKNGIIVVDVSNPRQPKMLSTFTEELTGGVHNTFISKDHVYALSAGRRYDVIDITDPVVPTRVSTFQLFEPGAAIHDVWVHDGIAYSSNWTHGVQLVDVGNGIAGGSPKNPVKFASYAYPSGWNHAAFPFTSRATGKFYVVAGDEAFPFGLYTEDQPTYARGWLHFIDFSDLKAPKEVARYQVPEAGTHNLWIEGDVMYAAFYNGGVRVVDVSGDLMGDLYRQGREIAWFLPAHGKGVIPNAPMVWGPQPHKGHIFFSDWNSGLWAVKLVPDTGRRRG